MSRFTFPKLLPTLMLVVSPIFADGAGQRAGEPQYAPIKWTKFVKVDGQSEPVPEQWLQDPEARIAHSLKLPDSVPKPVPFNFHTPGKWGNIPSAANVSLRYFNHLCSTEAGEWIFKKVQNVEGFYFARPQAAPTTDNMTDPYGPEMPWIQRKLMLTADTSFDQGTLFVYPRSRNYHFIEQPRRETKWQADIKEPFVRLFGYTREALPVPGVYGKASDPRDWYSYRDKDPMQVIGIPTLTAKYGYTWRGVKRNRDREHGISGGELIIYDLQSKDLLAVRRQFLIATRSPRGEGKAMWEIAATCPKIRTTDGIGLEFTQFAFDVLQTIEPSWTGKK